MIDNLSYAAGFIDGEGTITFSKQKLDGVYNLAVSACNVHRAPIDFLEKIFGGKVYECKPRPNKEKRTYFVWKVTCRQAEKALIELLPYLIVKREQAQLALNYYANFKSGCRWGLTEEEKRRREKIVKEVRQRNFGKSNSFLR